MSDVEAEKIKPVFNIDSFGFVMIKLQSPIMKPTLNVGFDVVNVLFLPGGNYEIIAVTDKTIS